MVAGGDSYAYSWELSLPPLTSELGQGSYCYHNFVYNFAIDYYETDGTTDDTSTQLMIFGVPCAGSGKKVKCLPVTTETMAAALAAGYTAYETDGYASTSPYLGGVLTWGYDIKTTSSSAKNIPNLGAYQVYFFWSGTTDTVTITGESDNAVINAFSAFTVAAVAGLFF